MILQALYSYYTRLAEQERVPPIGFSEENVGFILEIAEDGRLIQEWDIRHRVGANLRPVLREIPYTNAVEVRSSNFEANFLVDKAAFLLGNDAKTKPQRLEKSHAKFKDLLTAVRSLTDDAGLAAVCRFYETWNPSSASRILNYWTDIAGDNSGFVAFKLEGETQCVHEREAVRKAWTKYISEKGDSIIGQCLITGTTGPIQRTHAQFKGLRGGQSSGKSVVSFNIPAAESYGKTQAYNSPVSVTAEFCASTALKYLIRSEGHKVYFNNTAVLFWTERDSPVERFFGLIVDPRDSSGDDNELAVFLETVREGKFPPSYDPEMKFYILGLSPNAARLSVRFWHVSTVKDISERLGQHFRDLSMIRPFDSDPEYPGMWKLLRETSNQKSKDGPSPLLGGAVMQSILSGTLYPQQLLSVTIGRIRAEQNINYMRAAIIKAVLVRKKRILDQGMEVPMALDKENRNVAYLLGRLFAVLEKAQKDAIPRVKTTIKDRFYGSASASPRIVFAQLIKGAQYHIQNAKYGKLWDKQIEEIVGNIQEIPAHLGLDEQGAFAIGYYHQRQDPFRKSNDQSPDQDKEL
ncbi:MAG: type I-C CRISPR-associated protein Cas8c/Csd1 [candidate division Zixibacteria bacterium]|nr:type I-C CRISPR-associated protein Cas8c/Csd1 [candidate division Zixibacteria bacterium]MBU1471513.1 type I-C CRISPR-associated protein Cas8c/Csd1 [candidate division Zixibacteria bacterium]MBU2626544.1 type I-C CRISPR-associated protein Cas8c/Csd1 [candidate division Zixibacteria bacterium]